MSSFDELNTIYTTDYLLALNLVITIYPFDPNATESYVIGVQHVTAHLYVVYNSSNVSFSKSTINTSPTFFYFANTKPFYNIIKSSQSSNFSESVR